MFEMLKFNVFAAFLLFRVLSVFVVKTWFVPDEYWQSEEVAHNLTFGYGYLTWEWTKGIRSYFHPLSIAAIYRLLAWFGLDQVENLVLAPRIFQALLSAFSDYCFYRWSDNSKWSIFLIVTSWFWFYTATRTLINTVETCLTTIALSVFPRHRELDSHLFLWIATFIILIRPTAAILWTPLCIIHIKNSIHPFLKLITKYLFIDFIIGTIVIAVDSYAHGRFIITPIEFFKFNVLDNVGSFYGTHPWHWYFTVGLPVVLGITLLPFLFAAAQTLQNRQTYPDRYNLLLVIFVTLAAYSFLPHKEFRFILPVLPICLHITADFLKNWSRNASTITIWIVMLCLLVFNAIPAIYLSTIHQRGTTEIMRLIARIAREYRDLDGHHAKLIFLMPCHSTPFYSQIHQNVSLQFLTCEPNFYQEENYQTEADTFYANPSAWLGSHIPNHPKSEMPTHAVFFDSLQPEIGVFLQSYKLIENITHTEYIHSHVGRNILLYEWIADTLTTNNPKLETTQNNKKKVDNSTHSSDTIHDEI